MTPSPSLLLLVVLLLGISLWDVPLAGDRSRCSGSICVAFAGGRYPPPPKSEPKAQPKPPNINIEGLPDLKDVLAELNLQDFMPKFIRAGIVETRLLLRLGPTDFGIMDWDWGMPQADITRLREHINVLIVKATIPERDDTRERTEAERARLVYGRVYVPDAVQSFEFTKASFGAAVPIGGYPIAWGDPEDGCAPQPTDLTGKVLVVRRGTCTFLVKARHALAGNATALITVNTVDSLEAPSSGLGIDRSVTLEMVKPIDDRLPVLALANTSWAKVSIDPGPFLSIQAPCLCHIQTPGSTLISPPHSSSPSPTNQLKYSVERAKGGYPVTAHVVPLKCHAGKPCAPLLAEEIDVQPDVASGHVRLKNARGEVKSYEFLTSTFGGRLPKQVISVVAAAPAAPAAAAAGGTGGQTSEACAPLAPVAPPADGSGVVAVLVRRGTCHFDVKVRVPTRLSLPPRPLPHPSFLPCFYTWWWARRCMWRPRGGT
jgi:hypothetical protein